MQTDNRLSPSWRKALLLLTTVLGWLIYCYWDTATAMVSIWLRSETYTHALVVPPISLWLVWRQRHEIIAEQPNPSLWLTLPILFTSFAWLLGELTAVNALTQFALVATLVIATMAVLGVAVSKRIAFPLAFLFFAVPFGDFLMPTLMKWTAQFTVLALRASGIPVYQEGLQFVIPSGSWSVVEACSGIRYIIASVTVGTLFAYLNYVSLSRRLTFIVISILVPVVANWLRAYLIVMLGHLSGNKLAAGVDHLIYGWVFFGIVIMLMFMIGARWSEPPETPVDIDPGTTAKQSKPMWPTAVLIALIASLGPLGFHAINQKDQASPPTLSTLNITGGWAEAPAFTDWQPAYSNPSAAQGLSYQRGNEQIGLYIGYYRNQDYERKLITSTNLLVNYKDDRWSSIAQNTASLELQGQIVKLRQAELLGKTSPEETRLTVWYWYWINGKLTASDIEAKLLTAYARLQGKGDDSAVIMLFAPHASGGNAESQLLAFAQSNAGNIAALLQQTRNQR